MYVRHRKLYVRHRKEEALAWKQKSPRPWLCMSNVGYTPNCITDCNLFGYEIWNHRVCSGSQWKLDFEVSLPYVRHRIFQGMPLNWFIFRSLFLRKTKHLTDLHNMHFRWVSYYNMAMCYAIAKCLTCTSETMELPICK